MLSTVKYINGNLNNQEWKIEGEIGRGFENYIYKALVKILKSIEGYDVEIHQTDSSRDDGRDIIIKTSNSINLFGIDINLKGKKEILIYIECKSSSHDYVSYDKIAKNAIIAGQDRVDYLMLITNRSITPYTFYSVQENSNVYQYEFILVDQYILANYLDKYHLNKWKYYPTEKVVAEPNISYQICKSSFNRKPCFDLYLFCRNYKEDDAECQLQIKTDRNWDFDDFDNYFILEKNKSKCIKIKILKLYADGYDHVIVGINLNNQLNSIELEGTSLSYNFELPFTGSGHKRIVSIIKKRHQDSDGFLWFNLYGEAGVGKTRIIDELNKYFYSSSAVIFNFLCNKNSASSTKAALKKALHQKYRREIKANTLLDIIDEISDDLLWTIIFIEDIHNADIEFLNELEYLLLHPNYSAPVILITSGRDDYTVYNEYYFSFLEKINKFKKANIEQFCIQPLKNEECINLIKRVIVDIPDGALKKIHTLSNNNPFYLVQYIEYLLEIKLVHLLNRNTVGIPNILTFASKLYIPEAIEDLLNQRYKVLSTLKLGAKAQTFLMIAALYGIEFPRDLLLHFFTEIEYEYTENLFKSHFIVSSNYNFLRFDHETIYLFIKNKHISQKLFQDIFSNQEIFNLFGDLKKGLILCKLRKYKEAKTYLSEPIDEVLNMDNVSSENISPRYFEYLDCVYDIFKRQQNKVIMEKTLLAKIYLAMHNLSMGQAESTIENAYYLIEKNHYESKIITLKVKQLQASFYLHVGMISRARGIMTELLAIERESPDQFDDTIKYNLFERAASLYIHSNHMEPAQKYNKMSLDLAEKMGNIKLQALSKINKAKLYFFTDTLLSYSLMLETRALLKKDNVPRINCHNELGILTAEIILSKDIKKDIPRLIKKGLQLLENSLEVNYPLDIIRSHFLLALLYFISGEDTLKLSKKHIKNGIDASVRFGILKLMGQFYNLKALIAIDENQNHQYIADQFATMLDYLSQEDLLFLGNLDFTYSNIILLTNYLIFINQFGYESQKYVYLNKLTYYGYSSNCDYRCDTHKKCKYTCYKNLRVYQKNIKNIYNGSLLFLNPDIKFSFKHGEYFYPIYI